MDDTVGRVGGRIPVIEGATVLAALLLVGASPRRALDEEYRSFLDLVAAQVGSVLAEALAYFDCVLSESYQAGDHELVIGRVIDGRVLAPDAVPMTYAETGDMDGSSALYPAQL